MDEKDVSSPQHDENIDHALDKQNELLIIEAQRATRGEHNIGVREALRLYPKVISGQSSCPRLLLWRDMIPPC